MKNIRFLFHLFFTLLIVTGYSINAMQDHVINIPGVIDENSESFTFVMLTENLSTKWQEAYNQESPQGSDYAYPGLQPLPNLVNSVGAQPRQATTDRPQFEQKGLYSNQQAQYAQAPDYHVEMQQMHGQHHGWTATTKAQQSLQAAYAQSSERLNQIAQNGGRVKNYDTILAIITTDPAIQKIIKDYAFLPTEIQSFSIKTGEYKNQLLLQMEISEAADNADEPYLIATRHSPNQVYLHTIEGARPNHDFPFYYEDIRSTDKIPFDQCWSRLKPITGCSCFLGTVGYSTICCCPALAPSNGIWMSVAFCWFGCITHESCCVGYTRPAIKCLESGEQASLEGNNASFLALHPNKTIIIGSHIFDNCCNSDHAMCNVCCCCCCSNEKITTLESWNKDGRLKQIIHAAHNTAISSIAIHNDGTIVTGSEDLIAKVWQNHTEDPAIIHHGSVINKVATHDYGIATVSNHFIKLWGHDGTDIQTIPCYPFIITAIKICADGTIIFALNKQNAGAPPTRCDLITHYNPVTDHKIKELTLPADIHDVSAIEELSDETIIIGTKTGDLIRWDTNGTTTPIRYRDSAVVSMSALKNGAIAIGFSDNNVEFIMPDNAAEKLLKQCTLEQLAFVRQLIDRAQQRPNETITLHANTRDRDLFLSLPTYIRGALRSHCPKLQLPTSCCSSTNVCSKKNQ